MKRRSIIKGMVAGAVLPHVLFAGTGARSSAVIRLKEVREKTNAYIHSLQDKEGPYGCYRSAVGKRPDLYSSLDIAIMRAIMGEDLQKQLSDRQREEWIGHINSFAKRYRPDGSYEDTFGHAPLHANGMVIGALGVLGGKMVYPNRLYDDFNEVEEIPGWMETIQWDKQWPQSHLFWGGMHCYSMSRHCTAGWIDTVIVWLNSQLDEQTGWWRKGAPHADRHQALGGAAHIYPVYEHHHKVFPYPERVIDSVLALQLPDARWLRTNNVNVMHYLELDALYVLKFMGQIMPSYRKDHIKAAVVRYADLVSEYWKHRQDDLYQQHPHAVLSAIGTFGLLQYFLPDRFTDDVTWTDIFSDLRFYQTEAVEIS